MTRLVWPSSSEKSRSAPVNCWMKRLRGPARSIRRSMRSSSKHYDYAKRQIDRGLPDGPFAGVPFLLKDLEFLEGTRTTSGASVYKDHVAGHTGTIVQRFLDAGFTIFGKSSTPEFGLMPTTESRLFGPTRNPWNLEHSSGGSSGGAGAAVAARIVPVAHAQRRRRLDTHSGLRIRRVRIETDPRAQSDRSRSRRRLGRVFLRSRREHQRARQRGDARCDPGTGAIEPLCGAKAGAAFRRGGRSRSRPAAHRLHRPSRPMAMRSIPKSRQRFGKSRPCWLGSAIMSKRARLRSPPIRRW